MGTEADKPKRLTGKATAPADGLTQSERFIKAARELETDDDPERFKERVRGLTKKAQSKPSAT